MEGRIINISDLQCFTVQLPSHNNLPISDISKLGDYVSTLCCIATISVLITSFAIISFSLDL